MLKATSTYPFRALDFLATWGLWLIERFIYYVAWLSNWLAIIATVLLGAFILLLALAYAIVANETYLRNLLLQPRAAGRVVLQAIAHLPLFFAWLFFPRWISYPLLTLAALRLGIRASGNNFSSALDWISGARPKRSSPINGGASLATVEQARKELEERISAMKVEQERAREERQPEEWARKAREEMLKEGLTRRAKKAGEAASGWTGVEDELRRDLEEDEADWGR